MRGLLSPAGIVGVIALAFVLQVLWFNPIQALVKLANRDDWASVRTRAARLVDRPSRLQPTRPGLALYFLGLAHLVLGDIRAAERSLERALSERLPDGVRAAVHRQLAATNGMAGRSDQALAMLDAPDAQDDLDAYGVPLQRALVLLHRRDHVAAAAEARAAVDLLEQRSDAVHTREMSAALLADEVVARSILVRALTGAEQLAAATAEWEEHLRHHQSDRHYVRATLAEAGAVLAHATGREADARALAAMARAHYEEVGAEVDIVRSDVFLARLDRDRSALATAEQRLIRMGASGYLPEIAEAREELDRAD